MILSLFIYFVLIFTGGAVWGKIPSWPSVAIPSQEMGAATARIPLLADELMPDLRTYMVIGCIIGILMAVVVAIGGVIAAVLAAMTLLEKLRGPVKVHARTEPSEAGPTRVEFDLQVTAMREDILEVKSQQGNILDELKKFGGDQYRARGRMHRKMNTIENAMHFWAGKLAGQGDSDAKKLVNILESHKEEEAGEQ